MPRVRFTRHLKRFFPDLDACDVSGATVAEIVGALDELYPGIAAYVVDDAGALRSHVNIFVDDALIDDRQALSDPVAEDQELYIMQALSGG